jgi:hypothetical protein
MPHIDNDKIKKAALYTFGQMLPRALALVASIRSMNRELFPDDPNSQFAANCASINMAIGQLVVDNCRQDPTMADPDVEQLFMNGLASSFRMAREHLDGS